MDRGFGEVEATRRLAPDWLVAAAETVTRLGDVSTLVAVTVVAALLVERERAVSLVGVAVGGFAALAGLKAVFAWPRPPEELHLIETATTGFPSGHALWTTVVYGWLVVALVDGSRRRLAALVPVVVAVSLSRVVLGVHYLLDVVVGVIVAVGYLWLAARCAADRPVGALRLAGATAFLAGLAGVAFGPLTSDAVAGVVDRHVALSVAAAVGAALGWWLSSALGRWRCRALAGSVAAALATLAWAASLPEFVATLVGTATLVAFAGLAADLRTS